MMKRSLSEWASIAEILGAIAIVLSLIFVGLEIRSNNQLAEVAAYERNIDSINEWRLVMLSDPELSRLFGILAERVDEDLPTDENELFRIVLILNVLYGIYEKSFYSVQSGIMAEEEWERFASQACINRARAIEFELWEGMTPLLTAEFLRYLESRC